MTTTELPHPTSWATEAPTTSRRRHGDRLAAALRSEWIKATTVRTNKVLLVPVAVIGLLSSGATALFVTDETLFVANVFVFPTIFTAVLAAIAGVLTFTAEVQHGTLAASLTAHPSRWLVVVAKTVAGTALGLLLGIVGLVTGFLGALAAGIEVGDTSGMPALALWALLFATGSALLGLGVGMVVRHSAGAVSGMLVWWLVIEGLVLEFAPAEVVRFLPFDAGYRTLGIESDLDRPEVVASALSNPAHAAIFWGYVVSALAIGTVLMHRRDVD
jgi:ABC-2 type transport system permease protein